MTLRTSIIRLAYAHPEYRPRLLQILAAEQDTTEYSPPIRPVPERLGIPESAPGPGVQAEDVFDPSGKAHVLSVAEGGQAAAEALQESVESMPGHSEISNLARYVV